MVFPPFHNLLTAKKYDSNRWNHLSKLQTAETHPLFLLLGKTNIWGHWNMAEEVSPALRSYQSRVSNNVLAVFSQKPLIRL